MAMTIEMEMEMVVERCRDISGDCMHKMTDDTAVCKYWLAGSWQLVCRAGIKRGGPSGDIARSWQRTAASTLPY